VSTFDQIYAGLKAVMLMEERFERIDTEMKGLGGDFARLAASHAELAQRVAGIEGFLKAATRTPYGDTPKLEG
jgi:hypothetical protein